MADILPSGILQCEPIRIDAWHALLTIAKLSSGAMPELRGIPRQVPCFLAEAKRARLLKGKDGNSRT